jgi:phosphoglycerol transferase MdoB-like AlkP superfamily enzyme
MNKIIGVLSGITPLFQRLSIILMMMTLSRLLFYSFNSASFNSISFFDYCIGLWFDGMTITIYFAPFILISLLPSPEKWVNIKELILKIYFHLVSSLMIALNLMDIEYFIYTSKRSTFDLLTILGTGSDIQQLALTFVKDFWLIILCFVVIILINEWLYRKTKSVFTPLKPMALALSIRFIVILPLFVVLSRGGIQLRPMGIVEAAQFSKPENSAFILNTPLTMLKSYGKERLEVKNYFSEQENDRLFNPIQVSQPQHILPDGTNVMIIILESFGNEFVGAFNDGKSYTPFFDSLIKQSLSFEYGIANGKKSIEAVPSIIASIPSLMDNPYISSPYGNNNVNSLVTILKKKGYDSGFYHGATNGSMRFNGFAAQLGFNHYFGRFEYNNDQHFDKTWGILDEYFNPWTAQQLSNLKQPFIGTLFTLSSHHPYYVPAKWRNKVIKGNQPICASISYGDISLKKFFETAKKQAWYDNTLFVLVADHTPATANQLYNDRRFKYQIPIVFYHPKKLLPVKKESKIIQQLDIMPTILDLLNIDTKYYAYGQSIYKNSEREAFTYLEGSYFYFTKNHLYTVTNDKVRNMNDFTIKKMSTTDSLSFYKKETKRVEKRIKAIIQRYNRDLIHNKTAVQ